MFWFFLPWLANHPVRRVLVAFTIENSTHRTASRRFARRQRFIDFGAEGLRLALRLHLQLRNPGLEVSREKVAKESASSRDCTLNSWRHGTQTKFFTAERSRLSLPTAAQL